MPKPVRYPERYLLRLPKGTFALIARQQGKLNRAEYIRSLLLQALNYLEAERQQTEGKADA
jgi:hypothetical protein